MSFVPTVRVLLALWWRCSCHSSRPAAPVRPCARLRLRPRSIRCRRLTHACRAAKAATATERQERQQAPAHQCSTGECGCGMTAAELTLATTLAPATKPSLALSLAIVAVGLALAPETVATPAAPALDVGSPPSLDALCAHGLRAPSSPDTHPSRLSIARARGRRGATRRERGASGPIARAEAIRVFVGVSEMKSVAMRVSLALMRLLAASPAAWLWSCRACPSPTRRPWTAWWPPRWRARRRWPNCASVCRARASARAPPERWAIPCSS